MDASHPLMFEARRVEVDPRGQMRTLSMAAAAALALVALSGCLRNSDNVPPTVEEIARDDYARIAGDANVILFGDAVGYRAGTTTAERVPTVCSEASCSLGFRRAFSADSFSAEDVELEVSTGRNGVRLVVERSSSEETDVTVFGGWMEHSFFASQANLFTNETNLNHGATVFYSYVLGRSTGENPAVADGGAHWRGFVVGRDSGTAASLEAVVQGDAEISVEMRQSGLLADVMFTDLTNAHTGGAYDDMAWTAMAVADGGFAHHDAADDTIEGRFFGPGQEEVGGIFERAGIAGAFGGRRQQ